MLKSKIRQWSVGLALGVVALSTAAPSYAENKQEAFVKKEFAGLSFGANWDEASKASGIKIDACGPIDLKLPGGPAIADRMCNFFFPANYKFLGKSLVGTAMVTLLNGKIASISLDIPVTEFKSQADIPAFANKLTAAWGVAAASEYPELILLNKSTQELASHPEKAKEGLYGLYVLQPHEKKPVTVVMGAMEFILALSELQHK